ncbi:MAG TPA: protein kinase, partial [Myxococcaceae bacterium]
MTVPRSPREPVILFTHEGTDYEYISGQGLGPHGEVLLIARKRTATSVGEQVLLKSWNLEAAGMTGAARKVRARLEEETRLATYLHHPAILRVQGPYEARGVLYTAVEYAPGIALTDLITLAQERGQYPSEAFTLYLGAELASALHHAHTRVDERGMPLGIVHRNLNPETIRVTWEGTVKLGDFGLAHSLLPGRQATTLRAPRVPAFYTAPEVLLGSPMSVQADLFALGLVLLEVCTGRNPFDLPDKTPRDIEEGLPRKVQRLARSRVRALLEAGLDSSV